MSRQEADTAKNIGAQSGSAEHEFRVAFSSSVTRNCPSDLASSHAHMTEAQFSEFKFVVYKQSKNVRPSPRFFGGCGWGPKFVLRRLAKGSMLGTGRRDVDRFSHSQRVFRTQSSVFLIFSMSHWQVLSSRSDLSLEEGAALLFNVRPWGSCDSLEVCVDARFWWSRRGRKVLRIGIVKDGKVVHERLIGQQKWTVGEFRRNCIRVSQSDLPAFALQCQGGSTANPRRWAWDSRGGVADISKIAQAPDVQRRETSRPAHR